MPPLSVTGYLVGLVTNVASNLWSDHFQNFGSVAVTVSTSMARTLLFFSFGSIYTAAIANAKNNSQSYLWQLTYVLIISSNHNLNSLGVWPLLLSHSTTAYGTTAILGNFIVVRFVLPVVSHMEWQFSYWLKCVCISIGFLRNLISGHAHGLSCGILNTHGLPTPPH